MRVFLQAVLFLSAFIGAAGIVVFVITGSRDKLLFWNNLLAAVALLVLVVVVCRNFPASSWFFPIAR